MKALWIVGQRLDEEARGAWAFQGVFDTEAAAIRACRTQDYFIAPATLNEPHPHEDAEWPGAYYPLAEPRPSDSQEGGDTM